MIIRLDHLYLHTDKSEEWTKGYIKLTGLAWFSSFLRFEYSNWAIFTMLDVEEFRINQWLNSSDSNLFCGSVTLDKNIGFVVKSDGSVTNTNVAQVILTKDKFREQGYKVTNCFPYFPTQSDYRFIHLHQLFTSYFNSEWVQDNHGSTDYKKVIHRYKNNNNGETLYQTIKELRHIVDCFKWGEEKLSKVLTANFCCAIKPENYGLNYQQLIVEILSALKEGGKHEYFEKINSRDY